MQFSIGCCWRDRGSTVKPSSGGCGGVLLQIPGRTFCFCGTNGVGMSAYWWWPWRLRGDSVSSLRALCAWTREYVVIIIIIIFFKVVGLFFFNLTKIIPTWAQRMGGLWALEKRSRPAGCWRVALEALQLWNVQNPDASWKNQRWGSTISHTTMILHDLFIIFGPETWSREPLGCGRDRVRSLQLLPL